MADLSGLDFEDLIASIMLDKQIALAYYDHSSEKRLIDPLKGIIGIFEPEGLRSYLANKDKDGLIGHVRDVLLSLGYREIPPIVVVRDDAQKVLKCRHVS